MRRLVLLAAGAGIIAAAVGIATIERSESEISVAEIKTTLSSMLEPPPIPFAGDSIRSLQNRQFDRLMGYDSLTTCLGIEQTIPAAYRRKPAQVRIGSDSSQTYEHGHVHITLLPGQAERAYNNCREHLQP